ncbi:MAG TPA: hypothetical protein VKD22_09085 [Ramlibacter sp.]|nr:hypothetical protein [Ramlibacter sp.]
MRGFKPKIPKDVDAPNIGLNVVTLLVLFPVLIGVILTAIFSGLAMTQAWNNVSKDDDCPHTGQCQVGLKLAGICSATPGYLENGDSCTSVCHAAAVAAGESHYCEDGTCTANTQCLGDDCLVDADCPDITFMETMAYAFKTCNGIRGTCIYFYSNFGDLFAPCSTDRFQRACEAMLGTDTLSPCLDVQPVCVEVSTSLANLTNGTFEATQSQFYGCYAYFNCANFDEDLVVRSVDEAPAQRSNWPANMRRVISAAHEAARTGPDMRMRLAAAKLAEPEAEKAAAPKRTVVQTRKPAVAA